MVPTSSPVEHFGERNLTDKLSSRIVIYPGGKPRFEILLNLEGGYSFALFCYLIQFAKPLVKDSSETCEKTVEIPE